MAGKTGSSKKTSTPKRAYTKQIGPHRENRWISHVKAYAAQHNLPYNAALKVAGHTYR